MVCYLNQCCWCIIKCVLWLSPESNFTRPLTTYKFSLATAIWQPLAAHYSNSNISEVLTTFLCMSRIHTSVKYWLTHLGQVLHICIMKSSSNFPRVMRICVKNLSSALKAPGETMNLKIVPDNWNWNQVQLQNLSLKRIHSKCHPCKMLVIFFQASLCEMKLVDFFSGILQLR